jgi:hypothetical protein
MEPQQDLDVCRARILRRLLSPHSAHSPAALLRLAPLAVLTSALAVTASIVHGVVGARAMDTPPITPQSRIASPVSPPRAPLNLRVSVTSRHLNALEGRTVRVLGALHPAIAREPVVLQARRGGRWRTVAHTRTGAQGRFRLRFVPGEATTEALRVAARKATRRVGLLNVYREVVASYYGGGGSLACGGELTSSTMGVANKTLPCGTLVTLRYGGHSVRVPVVDRGPYVPGREFDLTEATKQALGFPGLGSVWSNR